MFKKDAKINLIFPLVLIGLGLVSSFFVQFLRPHSKDMETTFNIMSKNEFVCPDESKVIVERWGPAGFKRYCSKDGKEHGIWEAWEDKYKNIDAFFQKGMKEGEMVVWNKDGSKYRIITYKNDKELSNTILSNPK